ncbi:hypothetical protein PG630_10670 [Riemerella anatipestifer]|nr:hypothetical protein [Riemerella anatipestifer]
MSKNKETAYQVRINLKSKLEGVKVKPSYIVGIVIASNKKEASETIIEDFTKHIESKHENLEISIGSIKPLPSSFILFN